MYKNRIETATEKPKHFYFSVTQHFYCWTAAAPVNFIIMPLGKNLDQFQPGILSVTKELTMWLVLLEGNLHGEAKVYIIQPKLPQ